MQTFLGKLVFILLLCSLNLHAYTFETSVSNTEPLIGEEVILTLTFTYNNLEEYEIEEPEFSYFKTTLIEDNEYQENNGTWIATLRYVLIPQKEGTVILPALHVYLETIAKEYQDRYNRNKYLEKITLSSHPLLLQVHPLPSGIKVTGEYQLHSRVNKRKVFAGKPVEFTLKLAGHGNIDTLDFVTLSIPHTTVYETNTSKTSKVFTIVSDTNFTINPIVLKYFNQETREVELISTQAIDIIVEGQSITHNHPIISSTFLFTFLIIIGSVFIYYLYKLFHTLAYLDKKTYFISQLKQTKTQEALLKKVVPYMHVSKHMERLIYRVEKADKKQLKGLKKEIISHLHTVFILL